ncbi:MAG: phosphatidate cytidylyltransferase [Acidobacteria bacterium]|nr:phosphatidate cytidylyltransferase [Acidobacteriota bacterium]
MMLARTIVTLVLIPLVLLLLFWAPPLLFVLAILLVAELTFTEYLELVPALADSRLRFTLMICAAVLVLGPGIGPPRLGPIRILLILFLVIAALVMQVVLTVSDRGQALSVVATSVFGLIYIPFSLALLIPVRFGSQFRLFGDGATTGGRNALLFLLLVTWAADIGAYLAGRAFGRRRLAPLISPGKTVEGALAGLACSVGVGLAYYTYVDRAYHWPVLAGVFNVVGQFGDLFESTLKRGAGVKDSSRWIPGHGGFLDRLDSLLLCCPLLFFLEVARGT